MISVFVTGKAQAPWAQLLERNCHKGPYFAAELRVRVIEDLSGATAIAIGAVHY